MRSSQLCTSSGLVGQPLRHLTAQVDEDAYSDMLSGPNTNREDAGSTATSVDGALDLLSIKDNGADDKHPERCACGACCSSASASEQLWLRIQCICRRLKAGHAAFVERELPQLKADKPGLKMSQYQVRRW